MYITESVLSTTVITIAINKGGSGKTTSALNLGAALVRMGNRVCLIDADSSANLTMALGFQQPGEIPVGLPHVLLDIIHCGGRTDKSQVLRDRQYILNVQGMDLIPSSNDLAGVQDILSTKVSREGYLKKIVNYIKGDYHFVIIDSMPSLQIMTTNAINAADKILVPVQPQFLSMKGLEELVDTYVEIRDNLNPALEILGAVITMFDNRYVSHRQAVEDVTAAFGDSFRIFETKIPYSIRSGESQGKGRSIFDADPRGRIAKAYGELAKELIANV